jgi:DNA-binding response OmpR family regulator
MPEPPPPALVLVVDDDAGVRDVVCRYLARDGLATAQAADGPSALVEVARRAPALVVLDVMLPGLDGLEVCRRIRALGEVPVILLTARAEESDRVVGLELGADDYVVKPFSPRELAARVRAVLRRGARAAAPADRLEQGALRMDRALHEARVDGAPVRLTAREFDLLWFLAGNPRHVFSRDQLLDRVWGHLPAVETGTVAVHVRRLREKIEADPSRPERIQTVWGVGYRYVP